MCAIARRLVLYFHTHYSAARVASRSPKDRLHPLIIDGRDCGLEHEGLPVLGNSRAARLLDKDPRAFGAAVKQLYLSGPAGGAGLRELLEPNESMETDQPEPSTSAGRLLAASASTPTFWRGERDAAG